MATSRLRTPPAPVSFGGTPKASRSPHGRRQKNLEAGKKFQGADEIFLRNGPRWLIPSCRLSPGTAKRFCQPLLFALPAGIFRFDPLLDGVLFRTKGSDPPFVLLSRPVQCRLRSPSYFLAPGALLLPRRFLLAALGITLLLLALEGRGGLACRLIADLRSRFLFRQRTAAFSRPRSSAKSVGNPACSVKRPVEPAGRLSTTPGFAMVAATTSGSSLSAAKP